MKTYVVKKPFRVVGGVRHMPGEKVRFGDRVGTVLVERGLAEVVKSSKKKGGNE